jgi:hypothetical protein
MRWLLIDDPFEHRSTMHENTSAGLRIYKQEVEVVFNLNDALATMDTVSYDYVIIHHYNFNKVDKLRRRFPQPKYCADSANIFSDNSPGSIGERLCMRLAEHYDILIPFDDLEGFIQRETGTKRAPAI